MVHIAMSPLSVISSIPLPSMVIPANGVGHTPEHPVKNSLTPEQSCDIADPTKRTNNTKMCIFGRREPLVRFVSIRNNYKNLNLIEDLYCHLTSASNRRSLFTGSRFTNYIKH